MPLHRFRTEDYLQMIETGVIGPADKVELIDGIIVNMSPAGSRHNHVLTRLAVLLAPLFNRALPSVQGTLVVGEDQVFDPDFMLLRIKPGGYKDALPRPADVMLLIEAAEASLRRDRQVKLPIYAEAGIADYWIADVEQESLTVCRDPRGRAYANVQTLSADATVTPLAIPDFHLRVGDIFA